MKVVSFVTRTHCLLALPLFLEACSGSLIHNDEKCAFNSGGAGKNSTDNRLLVVIPSKELAPYEGLYYNKKDQEAFYGSC